MHAQLMGAAREGFQDDPRHISLTIQYAVTGHGRFAMLAVHTLAGPVVNIGVQGQVNDTLVLSDNAVEQSKIALGDGVPFKLLLQRFVGVLVLGKNNQD